MQTLDVPCVRGAVLCVWGHLAQLQGLSAMHTGMVLLLGGLTTTVSIVSCRVISSSLGSPLNAPLLARFGIPSQFPYSTCV